VVIAKEDRPSAQLAAACAADIFHGKVRTTKDSN
jgi:hypothetical protein